MLEKLYVDNYKCLVNFELPLQELTLLLGPNGAGKTAVLDIVYALRRLLSGEVKVADSVAFPTSSLTRWQSRNLQVFEMQTQLASDTFEYRLEVEHERSTRKARIQLERLTAKARPLFECRLGEVQLYHDDHAEGPSFTVDWSESALARVAPRRDNSRLTRFLDFVRQITVCNISPADFRTESIREDPSLNRRADNFADWYRHVLQERPDLISPFTESLRQVIGNGFTGMRMERVGLDTRGLMAVFHEFDHSDNSSLYELRFDELSDGQRVLVALYGLVHFATLQATAYFVDEPENYVALPEIQPWLMAIADACGETLPQAVLCSHHPELIDYLGGDCGWLLERETSGVVTARRPERHFFEGGLKFSELIARGWER